MIDHAVNVDYLRHFYFAINHNRLFMHCVNCKEYPLSRAAEEGGICIDVPEVANRGDDHAPQCVFLQAHSRDIDSKMRSKEDARVVEKGYQKRRQQFQNPHPLLVSLVPLFRADPPPTLANLLPDLNYAFIICILYQHHSYVFSSINVYKTAHIAGIVGHKLPKNEFPIEVFVFL